MFVASFHLKADLEMALSLRCLRFDDEVVVAMGAVLVRIFELADVFAEYFLALLAGEYELHSLHELMLTFSAFPVLFVALWAVEPHLAAGGSDTHLGVQNMLAHSSCLF